MSIFSLIILVGMSFSMVFEESRVLIRDSILRFAALLNEKLNLLGLFHYCKDTWVLFEFFNDFFQRVLDMFHTS